LKPTVLLATTSRWFPTARLAMALTNAGFNVEALAPPRHPLVKMNVPYRIHTYHGLLPLMSLRSAIGSAKPDLIIPGDDLATQHLHSLYLDELHSKKEATTTCALIERSLGAPSSFPVVYARTAILNLAQEEGVRVPKTGVIKNADDLKEWADRVGFPIVLKANNTSGGEGVRIVHTLEEAKHAFRLLQAPPLLARAAKRALINQDLRLVWPSLLRTRSVVNAQEFVPGREATSLVACWKGTVLASLHFEVLKKRDSTGPATVLRSIEDADMAVAAQKVASRLQLSGLHGFDFMLEAQTGNAHLIELNPRTTQVGHLALGPGRDLPAALYAVVTGQYVQEAPKITENDTIVLFPQEWTRNPASPYLRSGYHDVPMEEPELVRSCLRTRQKRKAWQAEQKWLRAFSGNRPGRP
jgi:Carbamoyl-phosphate synthase L chain, ATP binding domain